MPSKSYNIGNAEKQFTTIVYLFVCSFSTPHINKYVHAYTHRHRLYVRIFHLISWTKDIEWNTRTIKIKIKHLRTHQKRKETNQGMKITNDCFFCTVNSIRVSVCEHCSLHLFIVVKIDVSAQNIMWIECPEGFYINRNNHRLIGQEKAKSD